MTVALPSEIEAEGQVIGALLIDSALVQNSAQKLRPSDFVDQYHRTTFALLIRMQRRGAPVDIVSVHQQLSTADVFKDSSVSPAEYLALTGDAVATIAHCDYYADLVVEASRKRRIHDIGTTAAEHALNGKPSGELLADLGASIEDLRRETDVGGRFKLITSRELAEGDYRVDYLIPGILVAGQPTVLGGPKKVLKTSLLADLAISLDTGGCFLGLFRVSRQCRVLLLSGESGIATLKETANRICVAANRNLADLGVLFCEQLPRFSDPTHIEELGRIIEGESLDVVMVDPAYKCMSGEHAGNVFTQGGQLTPALLTNSIRTQAARGG